MAVVGAVGSGKSSLISAILGEMFRKSGDIKYNVGGVVTQLINLFNLWSRGIGCVSCPYRMNQFTYNCQRTKLLKNVTF